jgi:hypothetical protein
MADQSDVEISMAALVVAALYPNGPDAASLPGPACRVYRGWPNPASLDADLALGTINVTVFAGRAAPRPTTRFADEWLSTAIVPTLQVSVSNTTVTFSGTAEPGLLAGIFIDGLPFVYRTQPADTPPLVAATLGSLIRSSRIAQLSGASLEIPGANKLIARVAAYRTAQREIRRQKLTLRVTCWCPSPDTRDATAAAIDAHFASIHFIPLPDGSFGWLTFAGGAVFDQSENASLYRRDLVYAVEYATTITQSQPEMLFGDLGLNALHLTV